MRNNHPQPVTLQRFLKVDLYGKQQAPAHIHRQEIHHGPHRYFPDTFSNCSLWHQCADLPQRWRGNLEAAAHFMSANWLIRTMEIGLFLGFIVHIVWALIVTLRNREARPEGYAVSGAAANSKWYSRSMGLLGTLILIFLIVHLRHFWVVSRLTDEITGGNTTLFAVMQEVFSELWVVVLYVAAMVSLSYHLMHGFQSAFQSLGLNHKKYTPAIQAIGFWYSIIIPIIFAAMPIAMYAGIVK